MRAKGLDIFFTSHYHRNREFAFEEAEFLALENVLVGAHSSFFIVEPEHQVSVMPVGPGPLIVTPNVIQICIPAQIHHGLSDPAAADPGPLSDCAEAWEGFVGLIHTFPDKAVNDKIRTLHGTGQHDKIDLKPTAE